MNMPVYVSPEQLMKDRADFARKGVARGRPVIVMQYRDGILFATENVSRSLHKIAEIYDRIGFAAVGKYNEFEKLRVAGVRYADMRGYAYDRSDVSARGLANSYAQILGTSFTADPKPMEVELVVAEVGDTSDDDQIYRLSFDGSVADEPGFVVMGGGAAALRDKLRESFDPNATLDEALVTAIQTLASRPEETDAATGAENKAATPADGSDKAVEEAKPADGKAPASNGEEKPSSSASSGHKISAKHLELAVLERDRPRRKFRRLVGAAFPAVVAATLEAAAPSPTAGQDSPPAEGAPENGQS